MTADGPSVTWLSAGMGDVPEGEDWMDDALANRLAGLRYAKRHSEARLSRWTAKLAVAGTFGLAVDHATLRKITIRNAWDGAPYAYVEGRAIDAVIAMTDRADWAVCAVLPGVTRIGCDLELVEPRSAAFVRDYLTAAEQEVVAGSAATDVVANVIWSAKESALKVLRTGLRRDTRTVEVNLNGAVAASWQPLWVDEVAGRSFPGWWIRYGDFVLTCVAERPIVPPVALDTPPALAMATPSHLWMDDILRP
jgi:4'-phosphopantetheinyl transferase